MEPNEGGHAALASKLSGAPASISSPSSSPSQLMSLLDFPEPPTEAAIAHARAQLTFYQDDSRALEQKIQDAKDELARIVDERQNAIREMEKELASLDDKVALTKAYVSPIKRLPNELLRHIFFYNFDDCAWSAWVLSAVCSLWRRLVLNMPKLWSKVCLRYSPSLARRARLTLHSPPCTPPSAASSPPILRPKSLQFERIACFFLAREKR